MIITKTPFRISFVGGGSDLDSFYRLHTGAVLSTSINKYMYINSHPFFETDQTRLKYSKTETVTSVSAIQHPIVKEVLSQLALPMGTEISSNADIPAQSGLGSSSAFTVNLLLNCYTRKGIHVSKKQLAEEACNIEIGRLKEPIGKQDQYAAAYGGLNIFEFHSDGSVSTHPLFLKEPLYKALQDNLLLFYTGEKRRAADVLSEQKKNMSDPKKIEILNKMVALVWELRDALYRDNLSQFGHILHQNWELKKKLASRISSPIIDDYYSTALKHGALGGKLLGAGESGFLLFYCEKKHQAEVRAALSALRELPFCFEKNGAHLIYFDYEGGQS